MCENEGDYTTVPLIEREGEKEREGECVFEREREKDYTTVLLRLIFLFSLHGGRNGGKRERD